MHTGLDPARMGLRKNSSNHVQATDANYVELVYSSQTMGSNNRVGHANIIIENLIPRHCLSSANIPLCMHAVALELHELTVRKQYEFVAKKSKKNVANLQCRRIEKEDYKTTPATINNDECVLGILSDKRCKGDYYLSISNGILPLRKKSRVKFSTKGFTLL